MFELPTLIIPSLIAFCILGLFLTFWIAVVICLATANYPELQPLEEHPLSNSSGLSVPSRQTHEYRSNTGDDYKPLDLVTYRDSDILRNMVWFYLFGLIWTCEFVCGKFDVCFLIYYFYCLSVNLQHVNN